MSLYKLLTSIPRPIIHNICKGCHGCKLSCDHIIPASTIRKLYPSLSSAQLSPMTQSSNIKNDPHNVFLICNSLNKRKGDKFLFDSELFELLTDEGRGAIARSLLYMNNRYHIKTDYHDVVHLCNSKELRLESIYDRLHSWNLLYPPSINEIARYQALKIKYGINPYLETWINSKQ